MRPPGQQVRVMLHRRAEHTAARGDRRGEHVERLGGVAHQHHHVVVIRVDEVGHRGARALVGSARDLRAVAGAPMDARVPRHEALDGLVHRRERGRARRVVEIDRCAVAPLDHRNPLVRTDEAQGLAPGRRDRARHLHRRNIAHITYALHKCSVNFRRTAPRAPSRHSLQRVEPYRRITLGVGLAMFVDASLYLAVLPLLPALRRPLPPLDAGVALVLAAYPAASPLVALACIPLAPRIGGRRIALASGRRDDRRDDRLRVRAERRDARRGALPAGRSRAAPSGPPRWPGSPTTRRPTSAAASRAS